MEFGKENSEDLFDKLGLSVAFGEVEIGKTYPILGMNTKLVSEDSGGIVAELNYNIVARLNAPDKASLEILKERAFESGIFIAKVVSKDPKVEVECKTVIFGRKQAYNA